MTYSVNQRYKNDQNILKVCKKLKLNGFKIALGYNVKGEED